MHVQCSVVVYEFLALMLEAILRILYVAVLFTDPDAVFPEGKYHIEKLRAADSIVPEEEPIEEEPIEEEPIEDELIEEELIEEEPFEEEE